MLAYTDKSTLSQTQKVVVDKFKLAPGTPVTLSYVAPDGMQIELEDAEDFRAFLVYASRVSSVTVHVHVPPSQPTTNESNTPDVLVTDQSLAPPAATPVKRARRSRHGTSETPAEPETSVAEVSANLGEVRTPATKRPGRRQRLAEKERREVENRAQAAAEPAEPAEPAPEQQEEHAEAPAEAPAAPPVPLETPAADESDDDVPLSSQQPPSSQEPPSSQVSMGTSAAGTDTPGEKTRRPRRTKAEMEVFRAEQAAKKAERERERASRISAEAETPVGDETTIVHEEPQSAAFSAAQALAASGKNAMQQRLDELKAKKQRKNATEREEQRLLQDMLKESAGDASTTRECHANVRESAMTDAALSPVSRGRELEVSSTDAPLAAANEDDDREYFSQPESHAPAAQEHGPAPPPPSAASVAPMSSTPRRGSNFVDAAEHIEPPTPRRAASGFTKLSELRPSALRRTISRESPMFSTSASEASADVQTEKRPTESAVTGESDSDSNEDSDEDSDDDSDGDAEDNDSGLPLSKLAGAGSAASEQETRAKRKRSFFSALS